MTVEVKVPTLGESISEATIAKWLKKTGDYVEMDEMIVELETDKVTLEINAPAAGVIKELKFSEGDEVGVNTVLALIDDTAKKPDNSSTSAAQTKSRKSDTEKETEKAEETGKPMSPAAAKIAAEKNVSLNNGSGKDGRITKQDILSAIESKSTSTTTSSSAGQGAREERVKMTKLRQAIAKRLKDSQNTAAILTTFNEVDMSAIMELRNKYKESFEKKHGIKLGFMSFFVKAAVNALKEIPSVNAQIDGDEIIYKNYYDIGVAVGSQQGLVVPVIRDSDQLSFAGIEKQISQYGEKARNGKLTVQEMQGGTFTISNGGVFGSLLSTPIINPPQTAILGMHKTQERPVVVDGQIVIRPMMYLALSYDHRLIDGKEAVTFLVRVKECIEDTQRLLLAM